MPFDLGSISGEIEADLRALERENSQARLEAVYAFDANGKPVFTRVGGPEKVRNIGSELPSFDGITLTHNHPSPGSFSGGDIAFFFEHRPDEIRVSDVKYLYRLKADPRLTWDIVEPVCLKNISILKQKYTKLVENGIMTEAEADEIISHELWVSVSAEMNQMGYWFNYSREAWR